MAPQCRRPEPYQSSTCEQSEPLLPMEKANEWNLFSGAALPSR
jgi:hypothetical protein